MKIRLEYDKKNNLRFAIAFLLALVMYFTIGYQLWVLVAYGACYYLVKSLKIDLSEKLPWLWCVILFAGGATLSMFSIQYLLLEWELFIRTSGDILFLNVLCCVVVYLLILLFTNNVGLTCIIAHITLICFGFINYFVYLFRQNEFTFSDLRSIGTGLSVAGTYQLRLPDRGAYVLMATALFVALVRKCHVTFEEKVHMRIISVLLGGIICTTIGINVRNMNTETWEQKGTYRNGYILNFILSARDSFVTEPKDYSNQVVAQLEQQYSKEDILANAEVNVTNPTIIVIMSESFADLSVIGDVHTNIELTPFMDSLVDNTTKGYALSSVFGAKTPNSEWEYLTGNSMAFLPSGSVVYQQYISKTPTSLVSTLKNEGYTCVAMHPYYETGWSRNQVYPNLGYDEMYFLDDFPQEDIIREYVSDQELYNQIIERYEGRANNEKLYIMGITMQNHGGYGEDFDNFEEEVYKTGMSYTDANQYFSLIHESDSALANLITYFENVDEPVEIVFFGDHQPSLNSQFYPLLNRKGLSGLTKTELQALYTVPFFIWTNYESPSETIPITSLNYLSTMTMEKAGIKLPAYHQFLSDMMEVVPAINSQGYFSLDEKTYLHIDEATGEEAKWIKQYEILQYNSMFDEENRSDLFFPYIE